MGKFDGVLLASDMDGTLLNDQRRISQKNREAIAYFVENGGDFALCTGRTRPATEQYQRLLPPSRANVYLNGAIIWNERDDETIFMAGLGAEAKEIARRVMQKFPHIGIEIFLLKDSIVCNNCDVTREHFRNLDIPYVELPLDRVPAPPESWGKINFTGEEEQLAEVKEYLRDVEQEYNLTFSFPIFYEMTAKSGHKGDGVRRCAEYLDIAPEHVYTIGDSDNDIPMLNMAAACFVPKNGGAHIRQLADYVVPDNNHDAIAAAIAILDERYR